MQAWCTIQVAASEQVISLRRSPVIIAASRTRASLLQTESRGGAAPGTGHLSPSQIAPPSSGLPTGCSRKMPLWPREGISFVASRMNDAGGNKACVDRCPRAFFSMDHTTAPDITRPPISLSGEKLHHPIRIFREHWPLFDGEHSATTLCPARHRSRVAEVHCLDGHAGVIGQPETAIAIK